MLKHSSRAPLIQTVTQVIAGVCLLAACLVLPEVSHSEPFESEGWSYCREIRVSRTVEAGIVGVALESGIVEKSRFDLADVRVVSSAGVVVPIFLTDSIQSEETAPFPVPIYKIIKRPGKWTDLWIDKKAKVVSRGIIVQTSSKDFVRKVEIRGSDTGVEEYVVYMDGLIVDIPGPVPVQSLDLIHPVNNFRYIHLRFLDGEQPPLKLNGALCCPPLASSSSAYPVDLRLVESRINPADNSTVLLADLGEKRFPISRMKISSASKGFVKKVRLLGGSPESAASWRPFYEGTVFRIQRAEAAKESVEPSFEPQTCRYVTVELTGPGAAVPVRSLEAFSAPRLVIFDANPDVTYRLFYGNPQAKAPTAAVPAQSINLTRVLAATSEIVLGEEQKHVPLPRPVTAVPHKKAKPSATAWKIVGMVMLLIGLLLLFATMLKARSQRRAERRRRSRFVDTRIG